MAKKKAYWETFNLAEARTRYSETLEYPALGRLTDKKGYEKIMWGGEGARYFPLNMSQMYNTWALNEAAKAGYATKTGDSVETSLTKARAQGLNVPVPVRPAEWWVIFETKGLNVGTMFSFVQGWADWKNGRRTAAVGQTLAALKTLSSLAATPAIQALVPAAERMEAEVAADAITSFIDSIG